MEQLKRAVRLIFSYEKVSKVKLKNKEKAKKQPEKKTKRQPS